MRHGDSHCIFPAHTKRDEALAHWPIIIIREEDLQEFYSRVYAGAEGTNLEQAERRKNLPEKTAILVYVGTKFVGIQAGIGPNFATFPVRKAAERINGGADMLAVYHVQMYHTSDYKAQHTLCGQEGQSPHNCIHCDNSAKGFKKMCKNPDEHAPMRNKQQQAEHLRKFKELTARGNKVNSVNGVSKAPLLDVDFDNVPPACLHLTLGLGNDEQSSISQEAKKLDSEMVSPSAAFTLAENTSKQAERALEAAEIALLEHANKALDFLNGKSPKADDLISMMDSADEPPPEDDLRRLTALHEELERAAAEKLTEAQDKRKLPMQQYKGQTFSKRAMIPSENVAKNLEEEAAAMKEAAGNLHKSITSVQLGREAVERCLQEMEEAKGAGHGILYDTWRQILKDYHITLQRYWKNTMVGPDVRKFLENGKDMLACLRPKIQEAHGEVEATAFYDRHVAVIEHLKIVSRHTRKVGMLDDDELDQLEEALSLIHI